MKREPIAKGIVRSLATNGTPTNHILFDLEGPRGDIHYGFRRTLSGHDGEYIRTSALAKGSSVLNLRNTTILSREEVREVEAVLGCEIPVGCLLENVTLEGIPNFSQLPPMSRLVFPSQMRDGEIRQVIIMVFEENGPCNGVGVRLEEFHRRPGLRSDFVRAAQHKRGITAFVYSEGWVRMHDEVLVYPPVDG